jgi:hypothetical protein
VGGLARGAGGDWASVLYLTVRMLFASAVIFLSLLVMLVGIFWTLRRGGKLHRNGQGGGVGGEIEVYVPDWIVMMRRGEWEGPALPLVVAFTGAMGMFYGMVALFLLIALDGEPNYFGAAIVVLVFAYVTFNLARMFVRANAKATELLRSR